MVDAVQGARRNGHLVLLATGRSRAEIPIAIAEIGFDGAISAAGGFIEFEGALVAEHTLAPDAVDEIVAFFDSHGIEYNLQAFDAVHPSAGLAARIAPVFGRMGLDLGAVDGADAAIAERMAYRGPAPRGGIAKATFFGEDRSTFAAVRDGLGDRFNVITGTIPYLGEAGGEVSSAGVDKGAAILELVGLLGRDVADAVAIGDSANDVEMFAVAGLAIAMGNATPEIQARADEVTTAVHEDGVWNAFRRHGLL
ncbi:HAD family hydrolase [Rathayibacter sp. VKM Ac-2927]|nr:HAD family hydrolase [Rathayibacter sp. VKM Ac-2927]